MFSLGQLVFMAVVMVIFIIALVISYRKDLKLHQKQYKGSLYVLLGFFLFIGLLFYLKHALDL